MDDPKARRFFLMKIEPLFRDTRKLSLILTSSSEWKSSCELAAAGLYIAEMEGNAAMQTLFLKAIRVLAPISSPQSEWARSRLGEQ